MFDTFTQKIPRDYTAAYTIISGNHSNMQRIPDDPSIFTAEASYEPYQFKESTDSETFRKMS